MLQYIVTWIVNNPSQVIVILGVIYGAVQAFRSTHSLRQGLLSLFLGAQKAGLDGEKAMEQVLNVAASVLVPRLPAYLRPLYTPERIAQLAQALYDEFRTLIQGTAIQQPPAAPVAPVPVAATSEATSATTGQ